MEEGQVKLASLFLCVIIYKYEYVITLTWAGVDVSYTCLNIS